MDYLDGDSEENRKRSLREEVERFVTMVLFLIAMVISLAASNKK